MGSSETLQRDRPGFPHHLHDRSKCRQMGRKWRPRQHSPDQALRARAIGHRRFAASQYRQADNVRPPRGGPYFERKAAPAWGKLRPPYPSDALWGQLHPVAVTKLRRRQWFQHIGQHFPDFLHLAGFLLYSQRWQTFTGKSARTDLASVPSTSRLKMPHAMMRFQRNDWGQ